jgi:hypothetical protein
MSDRNLLKTEVQNTHSNARNRERRTDLERRRRVADMSPEEMMRELLTS